MLHPYILKQAATLGYHPTFQAAQFPRVDDFIPRLPDADGRLLGTLGTSNPSGTSFHGIALTADGRTLLAGDEQGRVRCYDLSTGSLRWQSQLDQERIISLALSPDERLVASGSYGDGLRIWEVQSGECVRQLEPSGTFVLIWSTDRELAGVGSVINPGSIWDAASGRRLMQLDEKSFGLSFSPDGRRMAVGTWNNDGKVRIFETQSREVISEWREANSDLRAVAWSPDGHYLAIGGGDGYLHILDGENYSSTARVRMISQDVLGVAWSPDTRYLAVAVEDPTLQIVETSNWQVVEEFQVEALPGQATTEGLFPAQLCWSTNGRFLAHSSGDDVVRLWDVSHLGAKPASVTTVSAPADRWVPNLPGAEGDRLGVIHREGKGGIGGLDIAPDGRHAISSSAGNGLIEYWDLQTGAVIWHAQPQTFSPSYGLKIAHDGSFAASSTHDGIVRLWNATDGEPILQIGGHTQDVSDVEWSPNDKQLASISRDNTIRIWDGQNGEPITRFDLPIGNLHHLSWSPNGQWLAIAPDYAYIAIINTTLWTIEARWDTTANVYSIAWSPNSRLLAVGVEGGEVQVWGWPELELRQSLRGHTAFHLNAIAWSPDGQYLASGGYADETLRVWDTSSGTQALQFSVIQDVKHVRWSPNGAFLISGSTASAEIETWDVRTLNVQVPGVRTADLPVGDPPAALGRLLTSFLRLSLLGIYAPLALVCDLLTLLSGLDIPPDLEPLAQHPGIRQLVALRWSRAARTGLVALLLHGIPLPEWEKPNGLSSADLRTGLRTLLAGEQGIPEVPGYPLLLLQQAADRVDDRLLSLLHLLGEDAVATNPALPLRLLPQLPKLLPLTDAQSRAFVVQQRSAGADGRASGRSPDASRAEVSGVDAGQRTDWDNLLPTQLALPLDIQQFRYRRGELLFRSRQLAAPTRFKPTVIVLDTSPPVFGPIERLTRFAATLIATTLMQHQVSVMLVTPGDTSPHFCPLAQRADIVPIWTERTLRPANSAACLRLAAALRATLASDGGAEAQILLLTHAWFGAEDEVPLRQHLRGLFVQYPKQSVSPSLAAYCERWHSLSPDTDGSLTSYITDLIT